jgi:hypothetical protein
VGDPTVVAALSPFTTVAGNGDAYAGGQAIGTDGVTVMAAGIVAHANLLVSALDEPLGSAAIILSVNAEVWNIGTYWVTYVSLPMAEATMRALVTTARGLTAKSIVMKVGETDL